MFDLFLFLWKFLAIQKNDDNSPASPRGSLNGHSTLKEGELIGDSQDQSALQETRLSLNGFPPSSNEQQTGRKRSYAASLISVAAPSCLSVGDPEPLSKVAKVSEGDSTDPFVSALLASKDKAKKHASNVTVVDEIPPPSGSRNTRYCMWNNDKDLKEIIDVYFRSCMEDKVHNQLSPTFPLSMFQSSING